jgi:hypothetical protein
MILWRPFSFKHQSVLFSSSSRQGSFLSLYPVCLWVPLPICIFKCILFTDCYHFFSGIFTSKTGIFLLLLLLFIPYSVSILMNLNTFVHSTKYKMLRDKDGPEIMRMTNQWLPQLETHPMRESQPQTLVMMLCYTCTEEPRVTVLWELPLSSSWKQMHRSTAKQ